MAEIALFHSILGPRPAIVQAAERLRSAGHVVHVPDLFEGDPPLDSYAEGTARLERIGVPTVIGRARAAVEPFGPGDGYGEHPDGSPFDGTGVGRGWPILVGERGHYELDAGRDPRPYLEAMRRMASSAGMLPEQVWDADPIPARDLYPGRPSGSAMPLAWAHAEYVKLVRSIALGHSIDRPEAAWRRYGGRVPKPVRATWRFSAPRPSMPAGRVLRLELLAPARIHYSLDGSASWSDLDARDTGLGVWVADIPGSERLTPGEGVDFTIWWPASNTWEGRNLRVEVGAAPIRR